MHVRSNLCHYSILDLNQTANDFVLPSDLYGTMNTKNATFATALAGSIFASGGLGWDFYANKPRQCVIFGLSHYGKTAITTSPNEVTLVDAIAGTTEFVRLPVHASAVYNAESRGAIILPPFSGWALKVTTTDATAKLILYWDFF